VARLTRTTAIHVSRPPSRRSWRIAPGSWRRSSTSPWTPVDPWRGTNVQRLASTAATRKPTSPRLLDLNQLRLAAASPSVSTENAPPEMYLGRPFRLRSLSGISQDHSPSGRPVSQDHSPLAGPSFSPAFPLWAAEFLRTIPPCVTRRVALSGSASEPTRRADGVPRDHDDRNQRSTTTMGQRDPEEAPRGAARARSEDRERGSRGPARWSG
jgi:hypothetical protein